MKKNFNLPDTIIYKLKFPTYWIFTSKKDGILKQKSETTITKDNIIKTFLKKDKKDKYSCEKDSGIVAQWIYDRKHKTGKLKDIYLKALQVKKSTKMKLLQNILMNKI